MTATAVRHLPLPSQVSCYCSYCLAGKGHSIIPRWPRLTARLQRSAGGRLLSLRIWSSHLLWGQPGGRCHWLLGARPCDRLTSMAVECPVSWDWMSDSWLHDRHCDDNWESWRWMGDRWSWRSHRSGCNATSPLAQLYLTASILLISLLSLV